MAPVEGVGQTLTAMFEHDGQKETVYFLNYF